MHALSAQQQADDDGENRQQHEPDVAISAGLGIKNRQYKQAEGIVGNSEQKQERYRRVGSTENDARDHVAESDVRGAGDRPAVGQGLIFADEMSAVEVDQRRANHAADCGDDRDCSTLGVVQRPAGKRRLPDLLAGYGEKEGHENIIDEKMQGDDFVPIMRHTDEIVDEQGELQEMLIRFVVDIGPGQAEQCTDNQECRVLQQEVQGPLDHVSPLSVCP